MEVKIRSRQKKVAENQPPKVWGMKMRQTINGIKHDYTDIAVQGRFVGLGGWKHEYGDPNSPNIPLDQIDNKQREKWSRGQIKSFVKEVRKGDVFLLAKKDSRFLSVGFVSGEKPFVEDSEPISLRLRWKVDWIENLKNKYPKENLLGLGWLGQRSIVHKDLLEPYIADITEGRRIRIRQIHFDKNNKSQSVNEVKERIKILPPSYFEELVTFLAEEMGVQTEPIPKIGSTDGGIDARGWRANGLFIDDPEINCQKFCIQVKHGDVSESIAKNLRENLQSDETGILVTGRDSDLQVSKPELFEDKRIILIDADRISKYVLQLHDRLPVHIANIFNIVDGVDPYF